ncbi:MAG: ABC transporter permease [Verrucomicrobiaceae bacterium]|jgi:phospholipid/cholesterol/gamma-HCH transport system permease protein|nr:ABC transporter permease [Verrucomicrobiaceae bacterium]
MSTHLQILQALLAFFGQLPVPSSWRRPVVDRVARQIVFAGVGALPLLALIAAGLGVLAAQQGELWLTYTRRADLMHAVLDTGLVREVAPLLSVLLALATNGAPMCAEMAMMRVNREIVVLRCQGVCEFGYLVFPRMLGLALACCCGAVVLAALALLVCSARLSSALGGETVTEIMRRFLLELDGRHLVWMLVKAGLGGLIIAAVACTTGLSAGDARTEVPRMVSSAMTAALTWLTLGWILITAASHLP